MSPNIKPPSYCLYEVYQTSILTGGNVERVKSQGSYNHTTVTFMKILILSCLQLENNETNNVDL